jgi:hypothetical protein
MPHTVLTALHITDFILAMLSELVLNSLTEQGSEVKLPPMLHMSHLL